MTDHNTVLFVCEHGAAKSVLAATFFNRLAAQRGLAIRGVARGTSPDERLPPAVVDGLARAGLQPCLTVPLALSREDLRAADQIVTFDQPDAAAHAPAGTPRHAWDGLPPVSADFNVACQAIVAQVEDLVARLAKGPSDR